MPQRPPNILFLLADDMRFDTVAALGNPVIRTPNLDALVHRGSASPRHFCTTPICTPARAEILTGCTSFVNRVPWFGLPIEPGLTLLPQALRQGGYHTIHIGKWHNDGHPREKGYDQVRCVFPGDNLNAYRTQGHQMAFDTPEGRVSGHATDLFADQALRALDLAPGDRPWFCYLAFSAPHDPHEAPPPYSEWYDPMAMPLRGDYMPEHPFDNGDMVIRDEILENWPRTQPAMRRARAAYYSLISHMDAAIGRVLGHLARRGELENTLVVFTADQGVANGGHGLIGKENMYDHSIAAPLILAGPGIPVGGRTQALTHHVDILPTLCALAGLPTPPSAAHGHDLVPLFRGERESVREDLLCCFFSPEQPDGPMRHTQRALRTRRWKLCWYPLIHRYSLFDLENDPHEMVDLFVPWRVRQRNALLGGGKTWVRDPWAARDVRPGYSNSGLNPLLDDLYQRMLVQMEQHRDPLLAFNPPAIPKLEG
jgi:arylsulfatase A-like enzyme